jgi:RNA polymerase sigma-70 factor (ECF subfamily)
VDDPLFQSLVIRFRNGDVDAANELVRHYEPAVRRVVRLRLANLPLHAIVDSMDICQSVMASFFVRFRLGQYDIDQPGDLVALLATIARSKVASQVRHNMAQRRDRRRMEGGTDDLDVPATAPTPSRQVQARELLSLVISRMTDQIK